MCTPAGSARAAEKASTLSPTPIWPDLSPVLSRPSLEAGLADEPCPVCTGTQIATYEMLRAAGVSRRQIDAALRTGHLTRPRRGIYATNAACSAVRTAAAHGGEIACVSAARHLGLWVLEPPSETHVWVGPGGHQRHRRCECVTHWDAASDDCGDDLARILLQIRRCMGMESFFVTLESALRLGRLSADALGWLRAKADATTREALDASRDDADSGLESLLRWRLRGHGFDIRTQVAIGGVGRVDVVIDGWLLIETDGRGNHDGPALRHKDLVRDAVAAASGYTTLRFDYALVVHRWDLVEAAILGALALV